MTDQSEPKYFDLYTTGIGYLNQIRQVTPSEGSPFWAATVAALRGSADNAQYTYFECRAAGKATQDLLRRLQPAVDGEHKVLVGFTLSNLHAETFTFKKGDKAGETGISLKARLLRMSWAKVDGHDFYREDVA